MLNDASARRDRALRQARQAADAALRDAVAAASARADGETAREVGRARHAGRLEVLAARNSVIDAVFARAEDRIRRQPEAGYMELMRSWLVDLPAGASGKIRVNPAEVQRFSDGFLARVNDRRGPSGRISGVLPDAAVKGGFVLDGDDFSVDATIEARLRSLRSDMAAEIAQELFGK